MLIGKIKGAGRNRKSQEKRREEREGYLIGSFEIKITQTSRSLILSETGGCIIRFGSASRLEVLMIAFIRV